MQTSTYGEVCYLLKNLKFAGSLTAWLGGDESPPDFYAIGFQELDLSKEAFVFLESVKEEEWIKAVQAGLHAGAEYSLVKHIRLVGMLLLVYCKKEHLDQVHNIGVDTVGTGIMGKLGNKVSFLKAILELNPLPISGWRELSAAISCDGHLLCEQSFGGSCGRVRKEEPGLYGYLHQNVIFYYGAT